MLRMVMAMLTTLVRSIGRTRPVLSATLLACTLLLSACMDDGCNVVGPSESTGSHSGGTTLEVIVTYTKGNFAASEITVVSSRGGSLVIGDGGNGIIVIPNMNKDDSVTFSITGTGQSAPCKWSGQKKVFGDLALNITSLLGPQVSFGGYLLSCQGW